MTQELRRHARFAAHDQRMRVSERTLQVLSRLPRKKRHLDLRGLAQSLEASLGDSIGNDHPERHARARARSPSSSSSEATVWSPMWPIRIVVSLSAPYPDPIVHPSRFRAETRS